MIGKSCLIYFQEPLIELQVAEDDQDDLFNTEKPTGVKDSRIVMEKSPEHDSKVDAGKKEKSKKDKKSEKRKVEEEKEESGSGNDGEANDKERNVKTKYVMRYLYLGYFT